MLRYAVSWRELLSVPVMMTESSGISDEEDMTAVVALFSLMRICRDLVRCESSMAIGADNYKF
jgi:hypothetical protein